MVGSTTSKKALIDYLLYIIDNYELDDRIKPADYIRAVVEIGKLKGYYEVKQKQQSSDIIFKLA